LEELGRALAGGAGPAELLEGVVRGLSAHGGFVGLSDRRGLRRIAHGRSDVVLGRSVLDAILERRESVRTSEAGASAAGAPLLLPGRVLGLIHVMRWAPAPPFDGDDRAFLCMAGHLVAAALGHAQREGTLARAAEAAAPAPAPALLGDSEPMRTLRDRIERFAASDAAILVRGESGSGKELVARALHARSP